MLGDLHFSQGQRGPTAQPSGRRWVSITSPGGRHRRLAHARAARAFALQTQLSAEADAGPDLPEHGTIAFTTRGHAPYHSPLPQQGHSLGGLRGPQRSAPHPRLSATNGHRPNGSEHTQALLLKGTNSFTHSGCDLSRCFK